MVLNATFNNISVISWQSVDNLVEKILILTVGHFKVSKDTFSVLEINHHPIGQL
jgi:hypothetical protein